MTTPTARTALTSRRGTRPRSRSGATVTPGGHHGWVEKGAATRPSTNVMRADFDLLDQAIAVEFNPPIVPAVVSVHTVVGRTQVLEVKCWDCLRPRLTLRR